MEESNKNFLKRLSKIKDTGLYRALHYAGEGDVSAVALKLNKKLRNAGYRLTSYQYKGRRKDSFDRRWAIYEDSKKRPIKSEDCLLISNPFPNILNRKTKKCGAYKELCKFIKTLMDKRLVVEFDY